jgi:hypothetical protein
MYVTKLSVTSVNLYYAKITNELLLSIIYLIQLSTSFFIPSE